MFASAPYERPSERYVVLSRRTAELLARPIRGRGGFQSLLRRIQGGLFFAPPGSAPIPTRLGDDVFYGDLLRVNVDDVDALCQQTLHGRLRRRGGFQRRIVALVTDVLLNNTAFPEARRGQLQLPFDVPSLHLVRGGRR